MLLTLVFIELSDAVKSTVQFLSRPSSDVVIVAYVNLPLLSVTTTLDDESRSERTVFIAPESEVSTKVLSDLSTCESTLSSANPDIVFINDDKCNFLL